MKKRVVSMLLCVCMLVMFSMPVFAASKSFTFYNIDGTVSLTATSTSATAKTAYALEDNISATRNVSVTMKYTDGTNTYSNSDSNRASSNPYSEGGKTASITVYVPTSKYTVKSATSTHSVSIYSDKITYNLSVTK